MTVLLQFAKKKVLVTGGSGFIGSILCDRLCSLGAEVHAISRITRSSTNTCIRWWEGDVADSGIVRDLFGEIKPDIVFHLASEVKGCRELDFVLPTLSGNLISSVNILVAATEIRCKRIVIAGSLEEPDIGDRAAIPSSPYAAAKWASSAYARMFHALYQTPVVVARLFMVYGPGQKDLKKLVPYVTLSLLRQEEPELSSGQRLVDWIYVDDVVSGLLAMGVVSDVDGYTIELGSGDLVTVRRVVETLGNIIDAGVQLNFGVLPERPMEQVRAADIENTYRMIGWRPVVSLEQGIKETINWYKRQNELGHIEKNRRHDGGTTELNSI